MDKIQKAQDMFLELESNNRRTYADVALRNFEIQSRLAKSKR
jgi:uncharacterized protein YciU (UPF0263 family)